VFFVRSIVFNMQTAPPVLLLPSGGQITGATVSVLKEYLSAQGTQPEARALRPQLVTLAQECRAAQLIVEDRYFVTNDPIRDMRVSSIKEAISHLGGVPHAGALKPALVSQLVALNAETAFPRSLRQRMILQKTRWEMAQKRRYLPTSSPLPPLL
jgi:hypothetical protein